MADWNLRLVLNRVWGDRAVAYGSWAVQPDPSPLERAFWRHFDVDVVDAAGRRGAAARRPSRPQVGGVSTLAGVPASPYKGLTPFGDSELDALLFFGRERDGEIVAANVIAARLTVLYGPSGVGKSSLLRAGVARALRELPEEPLVVVFSSWGEDPLGA